MCLDGLSFYGWLFFSTKDRLRSWGMQLDGICSLCNSEDESYHHLFFDCSFSTVVWQTLVTKNRVHRMSNKLGEVLCWCCSNVSGKGLSCPALKCTLAATVYGLWRKRNNHIFGSVAKGHDQVTEKIAFWNKTFPWLKEKHKVHYSE